MAAERSADCHEERDSSCVTDLEIGGIGIVRIVRICQLEIGEALARALPLPRAGAADGIRLAGPQSTQHTL